MSTDDPDVDLSGFPAPGSTITLPQTYGGLIVADSNGNSMPAGTTITFTTDNGEFQGASSWTISDVATGPAGPFGITLTPDDTPSTGTLKLTIQSPGKYADSPSYETTWKVED